MTDQPKTVHARIEVIVLPSGRWRAAGFGRLDSWDSHIDSVSLSAVDSGYGFGPNLGDYKPTSDYLFAFSDDEERKHRALLGSKRVIIEVDLPIPRETVKGKIGD